jgi:hypothetical protein
MHVKVFTHGPMVLEGFVEKWLGENPEVRILATSQSEGEHLVTLTIVYE